MQPNTIPGQRPGGSQPAGNAPVLPPWPFSVGVLPTENASDYDQTVTMTAGTQKFPDVRVEPDGWLRGIWFDFNMVCAANAAAVAFNADGPFNAVNTILFRDTGGEQIFGPFNGYDWMVINKYGGYQYRGDPRADQGFSVTTGATGAGGSFHFALYLPLEISAADSLGAIENRSENSVYRVELTMEASGVVYSVAPTTLGAMEVRTTQDSYTEPVAAMSLAGRPVSSAPPSPGSLQYWKQENAVLNAGTQSILVTNGIGHGYRNIIHKLIRSAGTRANGEADWPALMEVTLGTARIRNMYKFAWQDKMGRWYGLTNTTNDTALGREAGVYALPFNMDVSLIPGDEARRRYLRTKTGNTLKLRGSYGNAGTLFTTVNYVVPRGNDFSQVVA